MRTRFEVQRERYGRPPEGSLEALIMPLAVDEGEHKVVALLAEEPASETGFVRGEEVSLLFLRWVCSCGKRAPDRRRFTLEENAVHDWRTKHADRVERRTT